MSLELVKTEAEKNLIQLFEEVEGPDFSPVIVEKKKAARATFQNQGLPSRRDEAFHYTDLRSKLNLDAPPVQKGFSAREEMSFLRRTEDGLRIVLNEDGLIVSEDIAGVTVMPLAKALDEGKLAPELVGSIIPQDHNAVQTLSWASFKDGVFIDIEAGAEASAIEIAHHLSAGHASCRHFIQVGAGVEVTLIESFEAGKDTFLQANTEIQIGANATVDYMRYAGSDVQGTILGSFAVSLGFEANLKALLFCAAGELSRTDGYIISQGESTNTVINALTLARGKQHHDLTLFTHHNFPHCTSDENVRAIVDDEATSVFQGKISVDQIAQKTDGQMMARGLLLSDVASVLVKPELEIFADDVQCGHGSTTGKLDEDLLFYLMARGIPREQAESLMVMAFAAEILEEAPQESLRNILIAKTEDWLQGR